MNFFKKKTKIFISIDVSDMKGNPEDLARMFTELQEEILHTEQLIIKFSELQDVSFGILNVVISFILLIENSFTTSVSIQAEQDLSKKLKDANFAPIVSKLVTV